MCGFAGFLQIDPRSRDASEPALRAMVSPLAHRGPDAEGFWFSGDGHVALGHRRLSILDLSPEGVQPMVSADGRWTLVYNGELYGHEALRTELAALGATFRGRSDTEVMLAAFRFWGVQEALSRLNGMFAFALWDARARVLTLGRDRMGEKPLYYGWAGRTLLFGSELKALKAHPAWEGTVDRGVLAAYLRYNYVPAPSTIYQDVRKLAPGTSLAFQVEGDRAGTSRTFWSLDAAAEAGMRHAFRGDDASLDDALEQKLLESVKGQMTADVPLGAFLSGGTDSSLIVALMQAQSARPVRTFTIGFEDPRFDEASHAAAVAQHLGTEHTTLCVTGEDALALVPKLAEIYDEPFGDSSAIPTVLLSALTRKHVTVSLSGDGADELFYGYTRYREAERLSRALRALGPARRPLSGFARAAAGVASARNADRLLRLAALLGAPRVEQSYSRFITLFENPEGWLARSGIEPATVLHRPQAWPALRDFPDRMRWLDQAHYLPDNILVKVDRASMAAGLECRAPFLDPRIVEFAWSLPVDRLTDPSGGKIPLRRVLHRYVPRALVERPKMGFGVPLAAWLRGPLRDWTEALLDETRLRREGFLDPRRVRSGWKLFLAGAWNGGEHYFWNILMFQAWRERWNA